MSGGIAPAGYVDVVVKAVLGGALIAALLTLARLRQYVITGLLVSIPLVSLYTWWLIGREHGAAALRVSVRAAMWSAIPWVIYLAVVYALAGRAPLWTALGAGVLAWLVTAAVFAVVLHHHA
jgi:uncharacterized membrane protein (GlpM family)